MMNTKDAYNEWSSTYDSVLNKTRDLEIVAGHDLLQEADFTSVLEIGCGTGKNTSWISKRTNNLTAVDFSEGMLSQAKSKINDPHVFFIQSDISIDWNFNKVTLIICSLVLEHIENIDFIFEQASKTLNEAGCFYICELHPYKQLEGSRAKFEKDQKLIELEYFIHHITDFYAAATANGFQCIKLKEWFDDNNRINTPRLISFLFKKSG